VASFLSIVPTFLRHVDRMRKLSHNQKPRAFSGCSLDLEKKDEEAADPDPNDSRGGEIRSNQNTIAFSPGRNIDQWRSRGAGRGFRLRGIPVSLTQSSAKAGEVPQFPFLGIPASLARFALFLDSVSLAWKYE
jgi:hypothetical protein